MHCSERSVEMSEDGLKDGDRTAAPSTIPVNSVDGRQANMLRIKRLGIDTCHETVAFLARTCPLYRAEEFVALARIEIRGGGRRIVATLNIVDDSSIMAADQLGLSAVAYRRLGLPEGVTVEIAQAAPPASLQIRQRGQQGEVRVGTPTSPSGERVSHARDEP